jgi:hypothetical protein
MAVGRFFADKDSLQAWGVLRPSAADSDMQSALLADDFLVRHLEAMSRVFWGLHARSCAIWNGGVYQMVGLCGTEVQVDRAIARCKRLVPRLRALEDLLSADAGRNHRLAEFGADFIWRRGVVYREMMGLIAAGNINAAKDYAFRMHCGVAHEKGAFPN